MPDTKPTEPATHDEPLKQPIAAYDKAAEGKVELTDVEIEVYLTTMQALRQAAATIADALHSYRDYKPNDYGEKHPLKTILIYNEQDATAVRQYRVFDLFTRTIADTYRQLLDEIENQESQPLGDATREAEVASDFVAGALLSPQVVAAGLNIAGLGLQSVANVLSFFRTNMTVKGVKVDLTESALVASFVKLLHARTTQDDAITVYYPALFPLETSKRSGALTARLEELSGLRQQGEEKLQTLQQNKKPTPREQAFLDELKKANAAYDKFIGGLLTPGDKGEMDPLLMLFRAATLQERLDGGAHWLHLQVQKAGGDLTTKTGGLLGRSEFVCRGGVVVSYMLVDPDMTIVRSGDAVGYVNHRDLNDLQKGVQS